MNELIKRVIIVVVLALLAGAGYYIYNTQNVDLELNPYSTIDSTVLNDSQQFIQRGQVLRSVDISTELYADPAFQQLRSFNDPIQPVPTGRENPFLEAEDPTNTVNFEVTTP